MLFEVEPLQGVGPLRLGMTPDETHAVLATLGNPLWMCLGGYWSIFRAGGLTIDTKFFNDTLDSISLDAPTENGPDQVRLRDIDLFTTPARSVINTLGSHTEIVQNREYWCEVPELELYLGSDGETIDKPFTRAMITLPNPN